MNDEDALLHSRKFYERVNYIVNENEHFRHFFKEMELDSKIRDCTMQSVNTWKSNTMNQLLQTVPSQVSHQISLQMPTYLLQNVEMQKILHSHMNDLNKELENYARDILKSIVEDPQYHAVNKIYFETLDKKSERLFQSVKDDNLILQQKIEKIVNEKIASINQLHKRINNLNSNMDSLSNYLILSFVGITTLGLFSLYSYLK